MKKNKTNRKIAAAIISLSTATVLLAGSTFAWFAISNTAEATISGTAVKVENMRVGLVTDAGLGEDFANGTNSYDRDIKWIKSYSTLNDQTAFNTGLNAAVKAARGDGVDETAFVITPVTTSENDGNSKINLYKAPTLTNPKNDVAAANDDYITYTIAFKTQQANTPIYLNRAGMAFSTDQTEASLLGALRIGFSQDNTHKIFAPYTTGNNDIEIEVGGQLDLNGDYVYDYEENVASGTAQTVWYGAGESDSADLTADEITASSYPRDEGTNDDSFTATYLKYRESQVNYGLTVKKSTCADIPTQTAFGMNHFTYEPDAEAATTSNPIATSDADGIAKVEVKIWLEGWDKACKNDVMGAVFNTTIAFVAPVLDDAPTTGGETGPEVEIPEVDPTPAP